MEQRTTEWFLARKGKFTASEIHNLLIASRKKDETFGETAMSYIKEKVAEYVMSDDVFIDAQDMAFSNASPTPPPAGGRSTRPRPGRSTRT